MQSFVDQFLPSLGSLGLWGYWVVALLVLAQGFAPTSALSPASVVVVFAGGLAAHGVYDLGDMIWFVGIADALGGELSYRLGRRAHGLARSRFISPRSLERGRALFDKYGGFGILVGRFLPMGAFVPLIAGMTHMDRRRFHIWNVLGAFAYAVAGLLIGYFFGSVAGLISATATREGLFIAAVVLVLALLWFLSLKLIRVWPFFLSVSRSILQAVAENPDVRALVARHPRLSRFLAARLSTRHFTGLPTTLFLLAFGWFAWAYASSVLDFLEGGVIARTDRQLAELLFAFRDPVLVRFFTWVSAFGSSRSLWTMGLLFTLVLWKTGHKRQIVALWVVSLGASLTTFWLKLLFQRPRPDLAVYQFSDYSFPSGHATGAVAFFGIVAWIVVRNRWLRPGVAVVSFVTIAFLIGFSRLYLDVHYLSDVLNGYLVGALWLLGGVWALEWHQFGAARGKPRDTTREKRPLRALRLAVLAGIVTAGMFAGLSRAPVVHAPMARPAARLEVPLEQAFSSGILPKYTESILGNVQEPISLIVLAPDRQAFLDLFATTGWLQADPPTLSNLSRALVAAWLGRPYATAPMTPSFWDSRPHDFGFQRPGAADNLRQRHHARFWDTGRITPDGLRIFVGTASYDDGLKWGVTHHIDPNIDAERDFLVQDLVDTGSVAPPERIRLVAPVLGQNMSGDAFFTDGQAVVLRVRPAGSD